MEKDNDTSVDFHAYLISSSKLYELEAMKILQNMLIEKISSLKKSESEIFEYENENDNDNEIKIQSDNILKKGITRNNSKRKISKTEVSLLMSLLSVKLNLLKSCFAWTENYVRTIYIS